MSLSDKDLHAQGEACLNVAKQRPDHLFFARYTPLLQTAFNRYTAALTAVAKAETAMRKETDEGRRAAKTLAERAEHWFGLFLIEQPHLDRTELKSVPSKRSELLLFVDTLIDVIADEGEDLYLADPSIEELQILLDSARKELGEAKEAEVEYHRAVAEKRGAKEELRSLILCCKTGTRNVFGIKSVQYRGLRDSVFKGYNKKAGSAGEESSA